MKKYLKKSMCLLIIIMLSLAFNNKAFAMTENELEAYIDALEDQLKEYCNSSNANSSIKKDMLDDIKKFGVECIANVFEQTMTGAYNSDKYGEAFANKLYNSIVNKWNSQGYLNSSGSSSRSSSNNNSYYYDDVNDVASSTTNKKKKKKKKIKAPSWAKNAEKFDTPGITQDAVSSVLDPDGDGFRNITQGYNMNYNLGKVVWLEPDLTGELVPITNSWRQHNNEWYYFGEDGYGVQGLNTIAGVKYYFYTYIEEKNSNGSKKVSAMAHDTVADGYMIGSDGVIR